MANHLTHNSRKYRGYTIARQGAKYYTWIILELPNAGSFIRAEDAQRFIDDYLARRSAVGSNQ